MSQSVVPDSIAADLLEKIENQTAQVGIIGLGYVGLPLISAFTNAGFRCVGYDVDQNKVDALSAGRSYIKHVASETVADWIERDVLEPTSDMERLGDADVLLICVPTPLTQSRDPGFEIRGTYSPGYCCNIAARPACDSGKHNLPHNHSRRDGSNSGT